MLNLSLLLLDLDHHPPFHETKPMAPKKTTRRSTAPSDNFTEETFRSLKIGSDGKQPTVRHKGLPTKPDLRDRKKVKRSTELQRKNDLLRQNIGMVQQAIDNKSEPRR